MQGRRALCVLTYSTLSLSSAFAPPPTISKFTNAITAPLRGGGTPSRLDSWFRREKLGIYSPYHASSLQNAAQDDDVGSEEQSSENRHKMNRLQKVLVACEVVFGCADAKAIQGSTELETAAILLDDLTAEDLGVPQSQASKLNSILYTDVVDGHKYTMCIFRMPAGAKLPLHDHPGMSVLTKVLWGEMKVTAFDRVVTPEQSSDKQSGLFSWIGGKLKDPLAVGINPLEAFQVKRRRNGEVWSKTDGVQLTSAHDGNIHEFVALTPCCVVDVLAPPYDYQAGRRCSYYELVEKGDGTLWARPVRCPSDFVTQNRPYSGIPADLPAVPHAADI